MSATFWQLATRALPVGKPQSDPRLMWEHITCEVAPGKRASILKDMGNRGWELVSATDNGLTLFFKRLRRE